ncbi:MAG: N-acetylmuramoyl-L-alanine amidase, partial [Sulfurimonas sp.]|nr:N-acetylmuramoyl-L-alanine amidase [Sulfurimonas sp.]
MFRLFTLLLLIVVSLHALSDSAILKRANGFMKSGTKSNQFRAYNDYKNLYLRAIVGEDKKLRKKALRGIVSSGTKLHIDISNYSQELSTLKSKRSYKAPKPRIIKKSKKSNKIKIKSTHKLKSIRWKNDKLVLNFNKRLRANQINYFTLYDTKKHRFRYIFDIHASMLTSSKSLRKHGVSRIKIAQHNATPLRLVIENSSKLKI